MYGIYWFAPVVVWLIYTIVMMFTLIVSRHVFPFLIFNFYLLLFSFYSIPTLFLGYNLVEMNNKIAVDYIIRCLCLLIFYLSVFNFAIKPKMYRNFQSGSFFEIMENFKPAHNIGVHVSMVFSVIVSLVFFIDGVLLLGNNATYENYINNLRGSNGAPEYTLILILLLRLSANTRFRKIIFILIVSCFIAKTTLIGFRIVGAMGIMLAISVLNVEFMRKNALLSLTIGFLIMSYLGLAKSGMTLNLDNFMLLFIEVHDGKLVSHHGNVLWASAEVLMATEIGTIDYDMRLSSLLFHLLNTLIPSGLLRSFDLPSLGVILQQERITSGGGLWLVFAFVDFGVVGVIITTFWPVFLFRKLLKLQFTSMSLHVISIVGVMVVVLSFRWISYDFGNFLFRLPLYTGILISLMIAMSKIGTRRENIIC